MKRNIRLHDQRERGAGGWVIFYTVSDIPYQKGFEQNGENCYSGRVGMDFGADEIFRAHRAKAMLLAIPDEKWNHRNAWDIFAESACPCGENCELTCLCGCRVDEHRVPDISDCAERGIDWEEAYCSGKLVCCNQCGDCYAS